MTFFIGGNVRAQDVVRLADLMTEAQASRKEMLNLKCQFLKFWYQRHGGRTALMQRNAMRIFSYLTPYSERHALCVHPGMLRGFGFSSAISVTEGGASMDAVWPRWHLHAIETSHAVRMTIEIIRHKDLNARMAWYVDSVEAYKKQKRM